MKYNLTCPFLTVGNYFNCTPNLTLLKIKKVVKGKTKERKTGDKGRTKMMRRLIVLKRLYSIFVAINESVRINLKWKNLEENYPQN